MGIRGAWSLISNDPRRFGEAWVCSKESILWIDGPSFVYFVALQPRFESQQQQQKQQKQQKGCTDESNETRSAPASDQSCAFHIHSNQIGQASPASISVRTKNLISCMAHLAKEVHIVMDGLAPIEKISTQIERLAVAAQLANDVVIQQSCTKSTTTTTASPPRNCKLISILAEWAVVDTIQQLVSTDNGGCGGDHQKEYLDNVTLHCPAFGEAEAYMNECISSQSTSSSSSPYHHHGMLQQQQLKNVVILSNDTDYLVYEHCPGFVPFSSLQFTPNTTGHGSSVTLTGYHYMSSKFRRAFFPNMTTTSVTATTTRITTIQSHDANDDDDAHNFLLTTVAGLAGCDYDDKVLQKARYKIIKSPLGALRVKHQNKPTLQMTLTAVLRYVAHYYHYYSTTKNDNDNSSHPTRITRTERTNTTSDQQHDQVISSSSSSLLLWRERLVQSFECGVSLLESLNRVHQCYYYNNDSNTSRRNDCCNGLLRTMLETQRLIEFKMIYLKPLLEKGSAWSSAIMNTKQKSATTTIVRKKKHTSKRSRTKRQKKKKKNDPAMVMMDDEPRRVPVVQEEEEEDECSTIYHGIDLNDICLEPQMSLQELKLALKRSSVWDLPQFQRIRLLLYGVLFTRHDTSTTDSIKKYVSEWRRTGNGKAIEYKEFRIQVPSMTALSTVKTVLQSCCRCCSVDLTHSSQSPCVVTLTATLLSTKIKWLWYLLLTIPSPLRIPKQPEQLDTDIENILSVAYFHARLLAEAFVTTTTATMDAAAATTTTAIATTIDTKNGIPSCDNVVCRHRCCSIWCENERTLEKFDTNMGSWIWNTILHIMKESDPPNLFFIHIPNEALPENLLNEWRTNFSAAAAHSCSELESDE